MPHDLTGIIEDVDEPEYASVPFILKNLSLRVPKVSEEGEAILKARKEVAATISLQLRFYVYCVLFAFSSNFEKMKAPNQGKWGKITLLFCSEILCVCAL